MSRLGGVQELPHRPSTISPPSAMRPWAYHPDSERTGPVCDSQNGSHRRRLKTRVLSMFKPVNGTLRQGSGRTRPGQSLVGEPVQRLQHRDGPDGRRRLRERGGERVRDGGLRPWIPLGATDARTRLFIYLLIEGQLDALRRQLEAGALGRALQLDDDA